MREEKGENEKRKEESKGEKRGDKGQFLDNYVSLPTVRKWLWVRSTVDCCLYRLRVPLHLKIRIPSHTVTTQSLNAVQHTSCNAEAN
jgi:hypothetical protein